jgi:ribosome-associated protein
MRTGCRKPGSALSFPSLGSDQPDALSSGAAVVTAMERTIDPHMPTSTGAAPKKGASNAAKSSETLVAPASAGLLKDVVGWLDEAKAEEIITIDLAGKSSIGDFMVVASGRSDRHVGAIAEQLRKKLKDAGCPSVRVEGQETCDWVLIDSGDIIVHVFRPEVREFYNLEKMWSMDRPADSAH